MTGVGRVRASVGAGRWNRMAYRAIGIEVGREGHMLK